MTQIGPTPLQPNAPQSGWTITGQYERQLVGQDGRLQNGVEVHFSMPWGGDYSVFVNRSTYSPANVRAAVAAYAGQLAEAHRLSG